MEKVRFGVIGTGGMGSGHCTRFEGIDETQLTAVCDVVPDVARGVGEKYGVPSFTVPEELLDSGLVDAVIIATPHYFHPTIGIEAFRRNIHVLSEKPISVTVSAADAMIAEAKASGCKFGVMFQLRSMDLFQKAREIVASGRIGEIYRTQLVMAWYRSQAYYDSGGWRATWAGEGGGVLINQAPHFLDLFSWIGGLPTRITGHTRTSAAMHDIEVEDEAFAMLDYANGAHGYLYASTIEEPSREAFEFCGERGKILIHQNKLQVFELDRPLSEHSRTVEDMWGGPKTAEVEVAVERIGGGHGDITRNFARAILFNEPLIAPGEEGLNAVELINGIIMSGKTGQPVNLPVDRAAYDALLEQLKAESSGKKTLREQRVTDPHYVAK